MVSRHCSVPGNPEAAVGNSQAVEHKDNSLAGGEGAHYESIDSMLLSATQQPPSAKTVNCMALFRKSDFPDSISLGFCSGSGQSCRPSNVSSLLNRCCAQFPWRYPRLYRLGLELRSLAHRIRPLCKRGGAFLPDAGPVWDSDGHGFLVPNKRTQARIEYIQTQQKCQPWLSPLDWDLLMRGWDAGDKWADRIGHDI
jgi:hypothetical protein